MCIYIYVYISVVYVLSFLRTKNSFDPSMPFHAFLPCGSRGDASAATGAAGTLGSAGASVRKLKETSWSGGLSEKNVMTESVVGYKKIL
jgi:hypothetical protein